MSQEPKDDDLEPGYAFWGAIRGKYYERYKQGTSVILLDPQSGSPSPPRSRTAGDSSESPKSPEEHGE